MGILLIDGEYLRKSIPLENLKDLIISAFGVINYPQKIIYYSALVDDHQSKILSQIKNIEINNKGYVTLYDDGRRVQKAVDGYIIADIIEFSSDEKYKYINVIAGDGDLIAAFEKSYSSYNKKINLIARRNSVSERLLSYSKIFYLDEIKSDLSSINKEKIAQIELDKNENNLKRLWCVERDNDDWVSGTKIGQKKKIYDFRYPKGSLNEILKSLEKRNVIELRPENGEKTSGYDVKFLI